MVSPMLVSYMLSHPGGPELTLVPAAGYLSCNEPVCFSDIQRAAHEHGEIALGLRIEHQGDRRVVLNPDRTEHWQLAGGDQLIVLADFPEAVQYAPGQTLETIRDRPEWHLLKT